MIRNVAGSARGHKLGGADYKMDYTQDVYCYERLHRAKSITDSVQLEGVQQGFKLQVLLSEVTLGWNPASRQVKRKCQILRERFGLSSATGRPCALFLFLFCHRQPPAG